MSIFVIIIGHRKRAVTPISIGATAPFSVCKNTESKKAAGRSCQEPDGMGITISR